MEDKVNNFLHKVQNVLTLPNLKELFASGSFPSILYGLPKIHKPDFSCKFQFRPIFSAYNTPSFKIARALVPVLSHFTRNCYTVDNTQAFVSSIKNISNADKVFMCSFDVENVFTNIRVNEAINIIIDKLFTRDASTIVGLGKKLFRSLLELTVTNAFFIFNSELYKQIGGLGMGQTSQNILMCIHEQNWLSVSY